MPDNIVGFIVFSIKANSPRGVGAKSWICSNTDHIFAVHQTARLPRYYFGSFYVFIKGGATYQIVTLLSIPKTK